MSEAYPDIARHAAELDKCVTCAVCQSVCPSYQLSGRELLSPRGRIVLLRRLMAGDITPEEISADAFDYCTLCYACQTACPAGVKTDLLFIAARKTLADHNGIDRTKQLVFKTLETPKRVDLAVTAGFIAQKLLGRRAVNTLAGGMAVPPLRSKPLVRELAEVINPVGRRRARVGFFVGCMANYVSDGPARASLEVLRRLGVEIVIPARQNCCGAPAFNNGDFETARRLARRNLDLFREAEVDAIVSADATCGGAFRHEYPELLASDPKYSALAEESARMTMDWATFIVEHLDPVFPETKAPPIQVTVHDSCHLAHTAHTHGNVRRLLGHLPGVGIIEMEEASVCCGFGGSFSSIYPVEAERWQNRKLDNMLATRAQVAVAASPGCISALRESLGKRNGPGTLRLMHPAELILERTGWEISF